MLSDAQVVKHATASSILVQDDEIIIGCHWFPIDRQRVPIIKVFAVNKGHSVKAALQALKNSASINIEPV